MAVAAVGTDGDAPHHRRFVIRTVGDGAVGHHRRFVTRTGGDQAVHYKIPTPHPPTYWLMLGLWLAINWIHTIYLRINNVFCDELIKANLFFFTLGQFLMNIHHEGYSFWLFECENLF